MENDAAIIGEWIETVNDLGRNLTDWEIQFMESITDKFYRTDHISDREEEILEGIYADKTP